MIFKVRPEFSYCDWHEAFIWFPMRFSNVDEIIWLEFRERKCDYGNGFIDNYRLPKGNLPKHQRSIFGNLLRLLKLRK